MEQKKNLKNFICGCSKGAFNNYMDRILPLFDSLHAKWTVLIPSAWTKTDIF
jgi:peptidoglycan/xylan/chitin deacetylase (PgdA/CDA1 family)